MFNKNIFNPATVSDGDEMCVTAFYRSQWIGVDGAPVLMGVNAAMPKLRRGMGLGVAVFADNLGKYNRIQIEGNYAYTINMDNSVLSMGIKIGVLNVSLSDLNWIEPDGGVNNDPSIINTENGSWSPNVGIGFQYVAKKWYIGTSILNLIEQNNSFDEVKILQKRQFYATGGYTFRVNSSFKVIPNVMLRSDLDLYQVDINVNTMLHDNLVVGRRID